MSKNRLEAFTDAVIAIVMTLLVLELHQPKGATLYAFVGVEHEFVIYILSFLMLAIYWNNHHHLFHIVERVNGRTLWANNFLILALTMFPFVTSWVSEYPTALIPQMMYGVVIFFADFCYLLLGISLMQIHEEHSEVYKVFKGYRKINLTLLLNVLALLVGYLVHPIWVMGIDFMALLLWLLPEKRVEKLKFEK